MKDFLTKANRIHAKVKELLQMIQVLDILNFHAFFNDWYFCVFSTPVHMNLHFRLVAQAIGLTIEFDAHIEHFFMTPQKSSQLLRRYIQKLLQIQPMSKLNC